MAVLKSEISNKNHDYLRSTRERPLTFERSDRRMRRQSQHQGYEPVETGKRGQQLLNNYSFFTPTAVTIGGNPIKYSGVRFRQNSSDQSQVAAKTFFPANTHIFKWGKKPRQQPHYQHYSTRYKQKKRGKLKKNKKNIIIIQIRNYNDNRMKTEFFQEKASSMLVTPLQEHIHHINESTTREP